MAAAAAAVGSLSSPRAQNVSAFMITKNKMSVLHTTADFSHRRLIQQSSG